MTLLATMTPVSKPAPKPHKSAAIEAVLTRVGKIPEGAIAATARRARMPQRHLTRLRQRLSPDIRISTLEKLSTGLGEPMSAILGEADVPPPIAPAPAVDARVVRRLIRKLRDLADDVERLEKQLGEK